jgi:signal transduction histidine kinase
VRSEATPAVQLWTHECPAADLDAAHCELGTVAALRRSEGERAQLLIREREAHTQAEEANRLKDQFFYATLSHELRPSLNATLGCARRLRPNAIPMAKRPAPSSSSSAMRRHRICGVEHLLDISTKSLAAGFNAHIVKPIKQSLLSSRGWRMRLAVQLIEER